MCHVVGEERRGCSCSLPAHIKIGCPVLLYIIDAQPTHEYETWLAGYAAHWLGICYHKRGFGAHRGTQASPMNQ